MTSAAHYLFIFGNFFPVFRIKCLCFLVVEATCSWKPQHSVRRYCACVAELSILTSVCAKLQVFAVVQSTVYLNVFVQALSVCSPGFVRLPLGLARHFGDFSTVLFVQRICGIHSQGGTLPLPPRSTDHLPPIVAREYFDTFTTGTSRLMNA